MPTVQSASAPFHILCSFVCCRNVNATNAPRYVCKCSNFPPTTQPVTFQNRNILHVLRFNQPKSVPKRHIFSMPENV